ncbi:MAG: hypothetical protein FWH03_08635 [Firmicutes bacterium]|nr:hypothetical protein [Bacillota bacterium]
MEDNFETLDEAVCEALTEDFCSDADPSGSYTGTSTMGDPYPEQDADDL